MMRFVHSTPEGLAMRDIPIGPYTQRAAHKIGIELVLSMMNLMHSGLEGLRTSGMILALRR